MKILIVNAHWNNRGDEAALCALIDALLENKDKLNTKTEITVVFKETKGVSEWPYENRVRCEMTRYRPSEEKVKHVVEDQHSDDPDIQKEIELVEWSDFVVYAPGGAVISDRFWWEKQLEYIFPLYYAQKIGKKTIFASPSVGPFDTEHGLRDQFFKDIDLLCLRESIGMDAVKNCVGICGNQIQSCDLAFVSDINNEKASGQLSADLELSNFLKKYDRIVGLTVSDLSWNVGYLNKEDLMIQIEKTIKGFIAYLETKNMGVILIPQLFGEQDDESYLERYKTENCYLLSKRYNSNFQQYLIGRLYAVAGVRYHCNIFAAKMGTPMIPIVYEQKMQGFLQDSGMEDWGVDISELSTNIMVTKMERLELEYTQKRSFLQEQFVNWKNKARNCIHEIESFIYIGEK